MGWRMTTSFPHFLNNLRYFSGGLAFANARPNGTDRDHRDIGIKHGGLRPHQAEIRPGRQDKGAPVHHVIVGSVAVSKDHLVRAVLLYQIR